MDDGPPQHARSGHHPSTGQLWVAEMGPFGGDELNLIERGANYGWPLVSNGDNYDKSPIPDHHTRSDFKAPIRTWTPVISPSGAVFYDGGLFPWRGNLVLGGLSSMALIRLTLDGAKVTGEGAHRHAASLSRCGAGPRRRLAGHHR
jgi:glucose/arabinose dehydrogenase